jgi:hypothetical protein
VLAVCDVNANAAHAPSPPSTPSTVTTDCTAYRDFRELLARPDIDALYMATGDRWHSQLAIQAMRAGKDVYCEKPISLSMREGEAVVAAANRYQRIYQAACKRRNVGNFIAAMTLVRAAAASAACNTLHAGMAGMGHSAIIPFSADQRHARSRRLRLEHVAGPRRRGVPTIPATSKAGTANTTSRRPHRMGQPYGRPLPARARTRPNTTPVRYTPSTTVRSRLITTTASSSSCAKGIPQLLRGAVRRRRRLGRNRRLRRYLRFFPDASRKPKGADRKLDAPGRTHPGPIHRQREVSRQTPTAPADTLHFTHVACHAATIPRIT